MWLKYSFPLVAQILVPTWLKYSLTFTQDVIFSKMTLLAALLINTKMETVLMRGGLLAFSGDDSFSIRAIPHKERTAQMSGKRYNKEVKKQLTMSLISDELGAGFNEEKQRAPEAHSV